MRVPFGKAESKNSAPLASASPPWPSTMFLVVCTEGWSTVDSGVPRRAPGSLMLASGDFVVL